MSQVPYSVRPAHPAHNPLSSRAKCLIFVQRAFLFHSALVPHVPFSSNAHPVRASLSALVPHVPYSSSAHAVRASLSRAHASVSYSPSARIPLSSYAPDSPSAHPSQLTFMLSLSLFLSHAHPSLSLTCLRPVVRGPRASANQQLPVRLPPEQMPRRRPPCRTPLRATRRPTAPTRPDVRACTW